MIFRAGHSTIMRTTLAAAVDVAGVGSWTEDGSLHYELATDIEPIPVYLRIGNFGGHLLVRDIESTFGTDGLNLYQGNQTCCYLTPVVYTVASGEYDEDDAPLLRPMFDKTDPTIDPPGGTPDFSGGTSHAIAYFWSAPVRNEFRSEMFHYVILPSTDEDATGYDPIDNVTFPLLYPGLIAKIGFAWVHKGIAGANVTASVRIRGNIEMTVP